MHLDPSLAKKTHRKGRRKINIEFISDKSRRLITFSKRKAGIMKKAYELATLTGTQVLLLVASETGHVYTFATPKLQPLITKPEGKSFIQSCLNTPDEDNPQDFEIVRPKSEAGQEYVDEEYGMPPTYMPASPPPQQYFGGNSAGGGYVHYPGNGADAPLRNSSSYGPPAGHGYPGPPPREQFEYADYSNEYRGEYHPESYQGGPPGSYPGRHLSYSDRGGAYPGPPSHHGLPPHPEHPPYHSDYPGPRDYSSSINIPHTQVQPQPKYGGGGRGDYGAPMGHLNPYHEYGARPDFAERSDHPGHHPIDQGPNGHVMPHSFDGMGHHQNGYIHQDHTIAKEEYEVQ
eukprot:TRINITY_DN5032_c0_g1_i1.p1 TRINITY_DN5032_c0_g1~~TRINITY_DN5032_c0_g1_i1.p1  ORF type:complete len:345 (-),score=48.74 TRINITY_DN5032_c0_g1_i1:50-1084(-)